MAERMINLYSDGKQGFHPNIFEFVSGLANGEALQVDLPAIGQKKRFEDKNAFQETPTIEEQKRLRKKMLRLGKIAQEVLGMEEVY